MEYSICHIITNSRWLLNEGQRAVRETEGITSKEPRGIQISGNGNHTVPSYRDKG